MLPYRTYSNSTAWRNLIKQSQLVSQVSSILLQRHNWIPLLQNLNLSSNLTPPLFLQILYRTQTHPQLSANFFNWATSSLGFKPDLKSHCLVVQLSLTSGLAQNARTIMDSLVRTILPASLLLDTMIQVCKGKDSQSKGLSFVLEFYSHKGMFVEGLEVLKKMRVIYCAPSLQSCNALLDALQRENEVRLAWCVFGVMTRDGFLPDKCTWSLIAQILRKDGKFMRIVHFLDMGINNSVMYNVVVDCYSQNGDFEAAFDRLREMNDGKLSPGFGTYSSILDGACKHCNAEVIERVTNMMVDEGLLPEFPLSECDSTIQKLCDVRKLDAAMMFFKRVCDEKIGLENTTYGRVLKALSKEGRAKEAIGVYRVISERGVAVKDGTYTAFLDLLCEGELSEESYGILRDIIKRGLSPSSSSLSKCLSLLCSKHRWIAVEELLNLALDRGLSQDSFCCSSLVEHYCSHGLIYKAVALHKKMEKLGASMDVTTYNTLLDGLHREGRIPEATDVFDYMKGLKLVSSASFAITIRGLCQAKELRKAMKLHDEMLKDGLKPDLATYKRLIREFNQ